MNKMGKVKYYVLLIYPNISIFRKDNLGGRSHFFANIEMYKYMGYRVISLTRFSWIFLSFKDGNIFLNIIPGFASPKDTVGNSDGRSKNRHYTNIRSSILKVIVSLIKITLKIKIIHTRANKRFSPKLSLDLINIYEINDEYIPEDIPDLYLNVSHIHNLNARQYSSPWPVIRELHGSKELFKNNCLKIFSDQQIKILVYGTSGIKNINNIDNFISNHIFFKYKKYEVHIYGDFEGSMPKNFIKHSICSIKNIYSFYDLGLLYYDEEIYDDDRLRLGSPTKLSSYIDLSLPVITNREYISRYIFNNEDIKFLNSLGLDWNSFYDKLYLIRSASDTSLYGKNLNKIINEISK